MNYSAIAKKETSNGDCLVHFFVKNKENRLIDLANLIVLIQRWKPKHESWTNELIILIIGHPAIVAKFRTVVDSEVSSIDRSWAIGELLHRVLRRTIDLTTATHIPVRSATTSTSRHDNWKRKNQKVENHSDCRVYVPKFVHPQFLRYVAAVLRYVYPSSFCLQHTTKFCRYIFITTIGIVR